MKPIIAGLAVALLVAAACSDSPLPTETELQLQPHFTLIVHGGCPEPFTLAAISDADGLAADRNGDGLACYLTHSRTDGELETVFGTSWTDNNAPLNQIGGCPNGFDLEFLTKGDAIDRDANGDGFVCTRLSGNGSTIVIDNNHRASEG